jgi:hypothetical protein
MVCVEACIIFPLQYQLVITHNSFGSATSVRSATYFSELVVLGSWTLLVQDWETWPQDATVAKSYDHQV